MFFEVRDVLEAKKVLTILTLMGNKMYALLRSSVSTRRPKELSFTEIVDNLAEHLDPKPIVMPRVSNSTRRNSKSQNQQEISLLD